MIDERPLSAFYRHILIKLIIKNNTGMPELPERHDPTYYDVLEKIALKNIVFDPISKTFKPFINVKALKRKKYFDTLGKHFMENLLSFSIIGVILINIFMFLIL